MLLAYYIVHIHTGVVVVIVGHPEGHGEQLEDVEWMQYLLHQQDVVGLHRDIDGVGSEASVPAT